MSTTHPFVFFALAACAVAPLAAQVDLLVPSQFPTIGAAIAAAQSGDRILVSAGTYNESGLDFAGKRLELRGIAGAAATVIDGGGNGTILNVRSGEPRGTSVVGLTFLNGSSSGGGGIRLEQGRTSAAVTRLAVRDCVFLSNSSPSGSGGGIRQSGGDLVVSGCTFRNNTSPSGSGAGIRVGGLVFGPAATARIEACAFFDGVARSGSGAGIDCDEGATVTIRSCLFVRNATPSGAGSAVDVGGSFANPTVTIEGCTLVGNSDVPVRVGSGARVTIRNTIVRGNNGGGTQIAGAPTVAWCNVEGGFAGTNNVDVPAGFVAPMVDDFRLLPGSPMVDAGDPATRAAGRDLSGAPRLFDGDGDGRLVTDLGAYETSSVRIDATGSFTAGSRFTLDFTAIPQTGNSQLFLGSTGPGDTFLRGVGQILVDPRILQTFAPTAGTSFDFAIPPTIPPGAVLWFQGLSIGSGPGGLRLDLSNAIETVSR